MTLILHPSHSCSVCHDIPSHYDAIWPLVWFDQLSELSLSNHDFHLLEFGILVYLPFSNLANILSRPSIRGSILLYRTRIESAKRVTYVASKS